MLITDPRELPGRYALAGFVHAHAGCITEAREGSAMSHQLDTPLAAQSGQLFIDDLYVFPGDGSTVSVMDANSATTAPGRSL